MKNISFDNPYMLLIALPLLAALLIPYFISVSKDNKSKGWIASLVIHIAIILSVSLAAAGLVHTTVMTRTKVYIVADVSYSSNRNLDEIDEYIKQIEENLPSNSRLGIVCFGKDTEILTSSGSTVRSVKEAKVDDSATDIASAIDFTSTLFSEGEIKRIILITDGFSTTSEGKVASAVSRAVAKDIKIDAVYLNNNLREGECEMQISDAEYTKATYLDHESKLNLLIESNVKGGAILDLYVKLEEESEYRRLETAVFDLDEGINIASFDLSTEESGVFDYKVTLSSSEDISPYNNTYFFTQTVAGKRNILLVTEKNDDIEELTRIYGDDAVIDGYLISTKNNKIPYTIEDLVKYDEIILSNIDIRKIDNVYAFVDSVDLAVSQYGKSLITLGDLSMQNRDDEIFARLEEILPISFGNANKDSKLYTIVMDISRSMYHNRPAQFNMAKKAAEKLVSILDDNDSVAFVTLSGEAKIELLPTRLGDCREELYKLIENVKTTQGTFIGAALDMAYKNIKDLPFEEKQVMLISDGKTFTNEPESAMDVAELMKNDGIVLSTISMLNHSPQYPDDHTNGCLYLRSLAEIGGGRYYDFLDESKLLDLIFADIADEITDSVVEKQTKVNINTFRDGILDGILTLPDVMGYVNSKPKLDATMVLSVDYRKNSTTVKEVPLYSYRNHGNGRVASFTSSLSGDWLSGWGDEVKSLLFGNMLVSNTPAEWVDYPFDINIEYSGDQSRIEIIPSSVNPRAKATLTLVSPDGKIVKEAMAFNLNRYFIDIPTAQMGKYYIDITYTYGNHSFSSSSYFTRSYADEYDSFAAYDIVEIYDFLRGSGRIFKDGNIDLTNNKNEIDTYEMSFRVPLLIAAVVLFVVDVVIRKFKWNDLLGLFAKVRREETSQ